jgi:hypothetical protein
MTDQTEQYAAVFGETSRRVMRALIEFAQGISPALDPLDVGRMVAGAGLWIMATRVGRAGAAAQLRALADHIDRGGELPTVN